MARHIEDEVVYYYDLHPTEEDLMGETFLHRMLVQYLMDLLLWLFHGQHCAIYANLNFYQTHEYKEEPLAPDIAVIKGIDVQEVTSWRVGKTGPAPHIVFEIASKETVAYRLLRVGFAEQLRRLCEISTLRERYVTKETWVKDHNDKPGRYARMGVQEYFAYDPNEPLLDREASSRLTGWQLDTAHWEMQKMPLRPDGSLWSVQLDSLLVPGGKYLYLYDREGRLRLTQAQAETERAEIEKRRADAEAKRAEALAKKLRSLGIDPDQL